MMLPLTPQQRRELMAAAICDDRTVLRAYSGKKVKNSTIDRLTRAARDLGLPLPPDTTELK
jgi:hypothetical protein